MSRAFKVALGSLVVGTIVLGLKGWAWWITGSIALYSDALESVVNIAAALAALIAIYVSSMPADANHPYGHHKAEYFSAVLEGVLIVVAALSILREAWFAFLDPRPIDAPLAGMGFNAAATVLNAAWAAFLVSCGRRWRSPALTADGQHLWTDVATSIGVLLGLGLATVSGFAILDPILATIVAAIILWSGFGLVRSSVGGLMDQAADPQTMEQIRTLVSEHAEGALEAHDLRTRIAGRMTFLEFHLVVPGDMSVSEAHGICDRIESALKKVVGEAVITIHVEPDEKAKHSGVLVL